MQSHAQTPLFSQDSCPVRLEMGGEVWSLIINPDISWDAARAHIADDLGDRADELHGRSLRLHLGGRALDLMEVRRISSLLRDGFKAAIIGIESTPEAIHRYAETAFKMPMIAPPVDTRPRMPLVFAGAPFAEVEDEPEDEAVPTDLPELQGDVVEQDDENVGRGGLRLFLGWKPGPGLSDRLTDRSLKHAAIPAAHALLPYLDRG